MIVPLSDEEARELLRRNKLARLGCITDKWPYVVPVNYIYDDGAVYLHSLPGMKINALRARPEACLQVDEIEDDRRWRSVIAFGHYEEIKDSRRSFYLNELLRHFPWLTPVESRIAFDAEPVPVIIFRIRIEELTGLKEE
ncbi:pyridoxamine 5'-phosphate oxidase family protein [Pyrinomonas methylaliphatogenes]|uniref:Predicted flavin-nucleotide-binding protein n=1 Tax=Pyrinomonas methylaliphatogenes TaxID=454194 RepID=A0A0B6WXZ6_9BACT|nr:pyridoxamine 5'-phosphate oxidase family protein [Pyrinomonas methylaliphatogenes]CDM65996.1 predicted flavin-nucleotide-binding protein [Pyrinomonas methylaliphatogenes]